MEKQKLIYVESKAQFSPSEVSDKAIVFIKDTKEIWTHGVYFSCSGAWATPITLSLTGDTTGSVSIDGSGNASIATTTTYLSGTIGITDANNAANTQQHKIAYYPQVVSSSSNLFAVSNNANAILSLNVHDYSYTHQLGFSSNGNIYHRRRSAGTWETTWKEILTSTNYTNYLNNTYLQLTGGTITDTLILKAGVFTTYNGNSYSGGRYQAVSKPNIRLIGDSTYGLSTIEFTSQKGDTSINRPSDSGFIQFQPYGVAELSSIGQNPTLKTTGESNALVLGVTNDTDDIIVLQSPNVAGLRHTCGKVEYYLPHITTFTTTANKPLLSTATSHVYTLGDAITTTAFTDLSRFVYATSSSSNTLGTTEASGKSSSLTRTQFWRDHNRSKIGVFVSHSQNYDYGFELASSYGSTDVLTYRRKFNGSWETEQTVLTSSNYNNYSPTLTGTGASGTWAINISGVATSASKVANALTIQLNGGTTAGTNKFVYDGSSAYTINITPAAIGASATSHTHSYLPLSGGTLGSSTASGTELFIQSSTAKLQLVSYSDSTNYIESGNSDFTGNATLKITGYSATTGSNLYFNFANIYCRAGNYTNIDSGNYNSYALPLSGGTMTGTINCKAIVPITDNGYSIGTSSKTLYEIHANFFKRRGSSNDYVLLGGGEHKLISDFAPSNVANLSSSGMGNSDKWTLVFEKSYPANYWYAPTTMFYIRSASAGCGILCFYNYWASGTQLNDYEKEVWFFGAQKSETGITFGGPNRDINDYFRIYIDKANFKYQMYYNRCNDQSLKIQELQFFTVPEPGEYISTGSLRSSFFTNSTTVVDLPTESSTLVRVPIKTTYNHDRTIKTTKSIYASSFYENSDIRLKENVRGIDQSDLTKQVDLVQFNFKDSGTKKYGVIAQQLEQVGLQNLVYENNGNKAVDYISLLVLEIQRLRNEIGELKQEINKKN